MNLKQYIEEYCLSESKFAKMAGITTPTLWNILAGKGMNAKTAYLIQIASKGKVTLKDLVEFSDSVKKNPPKNENDLSCNKLDS